MSLPQARSASWVAALLTECSHSTLWQHGRLWDVASARIVPCCRSIVTSVAVLEQPRGNPVSEPAACSPLTKAGKPQASAEGGAPASDRSQEALAGTTAVAAGASADALCNLPNAVSVARLVSGPVIGYWLLQGHYEVATIALAVSGASDWLDGFLARRMGASSVFGSYLDPLADKVLIGCVAAALLANGAMPVWLAVVVVGRDVLLVSGAFVFRLKGFGWRWPGREAFFRTADATPTTETAADSAAKSGPGSVSGRPGTLAGASGETADGSRIEGVAFMRPLLISKANTVLQLVVLGGYLTQGMYGWPDGDLVTALELATATTTVLSLAVYGTKALQGQLFK